MIPTPDQVMPLLEPLASAVPEAIRTAIELADALQPDPRNRDPWFWSHAARFYNKQHLSGACGEGWRLAPDVPNTGIHLVLDDVHRVRLLRSLNGDAPPTGRNRHRQSAWRQPGVGQQQLFLTANGELHADNDSRALPALNLLIDWHQIGREPVIAVSLPRVPWNYAEPVQVFWRVPFPGQAGDAVDSLRFSPPPVNDDFGLIVRVHPSEADAG